MPALQRIHPTIPLCTFINFVQRIVLKTVLLIELKKEEKKKKRRSSLYSKRKKKEIVSVRTVSKWALIWRSHNPILYP